MSPAILWVPLSLKSISALNFNACPVGITGKFFKAALKSSSIMRSKLKVTIKTPEQCVESALS